jgi:hypothetical protein
VCVCVCVHYIYIYPHIYIYIAAAAPDKEVQGGHSEPDMAQVRSHADHNAQFFSKLCATSPVTINNKRASAEGGVLTSHPWQEKQNRRIIKNAKKYNEIKKNLAGVLAIHPRQPVLKSPLNSELLQ